MSIPVLVHRPARLDLRALLTRACRQLGLDARNAQLIHLVDTAVFRLAAEPIVARVVLNPALSHRAGNAVACARTLAAHGLPVVRPLPGIPNPVFVEDWPVTFWHEVASTGTPATTTELAGLLTRLHRVPVADVELPAWNPMADLRDRIAGTHTWDRGDLDFLLRRCDEVESDLATLDYLLPTSVIHGDAHLGNLIATSDGPVLCDLDTVCAGPPEWDLVPTAVRQLRFTSHEDVHREMVESYGLDITAWDGFPVLRDLRELELVAAGLRLVGMKPRAAPELCQRLRSLRTAHTSARWSFYR